MTYSKVVSVVEQLFNNDSLVMTLYVNNEKLHKINTKFSITSDNTYDYRHEYLDTTIVSNLVSSITKVKFTTVERHFRTWRAARRELNKRLDTIIGSSLT
jgi:hypothetical protein